MQVERTIFSAQRDLKPSLENLMTIKFLFANKEVNKAKIDSFVQRIELVADG